jgi:hypothetical protein
MGRVRLLKILARRLRVFWREVEPGLYASIAPYLRLDPMNAASDEEDFGLRTATTDRLGHDAVA